MRTPRMTLRQAFRGELQSLPEAEAPKRFEPILGTSRLEPTATWKKRRNRKLIKPDQTTRDYVGYAAIIARCRNHELYALHYTFQLANHFRK